MPFGYSPRCMQMRTWHVPVADINGVGRIAPPKNGGACVLWLMITTPSDYGWRHLSISAKDI
jgi:hypothetical protein